MNLALPTQTTTAKTSAAEAARGTQKSAVRPTYLDAAATTCLDPAAAARMAKTERKYDANPASVHSAGIGAAMAIERARMQVAGRLNCPPECLIFTSCATESNNMALKGAVFSADPQDRHLIISPIEHPSVRATARWMRDAGLVELTELPVDSMGRVSPQEVARAIRPGTVLVSVMHANNEVGTVQPLQEIAQVCHDMGTLLHVDACQGFLKAPLDVAGWGLDLVTLSSHKVHGPKGVGALVIGDGITLTPLLHGGDHELGKRSGTLNAPGIAGFAEAAVQYTPSEVARITELRDGLLGWLRENVAGLTVHGPGEQGICSILNVGIPGWSGKELAKALDRNGVLVSASSACHSTLLTPSHVLIAMGFTEAQADSALRISLGRFTTDAELQGFRRALLSILGDGP
jgi:cysteine desulfurase